jgi:hypothetical protein
MIVPILFFIGSTINDIYGVTGRKRVCKEETFTTLFIHMFHTLIMTYALFSPFYLKDYISNLMFNLTMLFSWFLTSKINKGEPLCVISRLQGKICKNDEITHKSLPWYYLYVVLGVILYDIYMLFRA